MRRTSKVAAAAAAALLLAGLAPMPSAAAQDGAASRARPCVTSKRIVARQLRREDAYPVVHGLRRRHVMACHGRWAALSRPDFGDAAFNAHYRRGRWHYYSGYPMTSCRHVPKWLCPNHP